MPQAKKTSVAVKKQTETKERKVLGQSDCYKIKKYGLYAYQVFHVNTETKEETKVGLENVYGIVASDLLDLMFFNLSGGQL